MIFIDLKTHWFCNYFVSSKIQFFFGTLIQVKIATLAFCTEGFVQTWGAKLALQVKKYWGTKQLEVTICDLKLFVF